MKILVYSEFTADNIKDNLGAPDYSYYFVMRDFLPVLETLGKVHIISDPKSQADHIYQASLDKNEHCILLSFAPPQKTVLGLKCPTIPVFAWEFDSIPTESWLDDDTQDWRYVFDRCPAAITHSHFTVNAVKKAMGDAYPIYSIPSPVWDKFEMLRQSRKDFLQCDGRSLDLVVESGIIMDTHDFSLHAFMPDEGAIARMIKAERAPQAGKPLPTPVIATPYTVKIKKQLYRTQTRWQITRRYLVELILLTYKEIVSGPAVPLPSPPKMEPVNQVEPKALEKSPFGTPMHAWQCGRQTTTLSGIVFTSLFNPYDGRKNWVDMLTAFCAAFRDVADATLVFKLGHQEYESALNGIMMCMARMPKFRCRILVIHGFLENESFDALIRNTHFVLNSSHGEGQCLPLMEFMSCGVPAIAPRNSAMLDYMDEETGFVVKSWDDATAWSHDPRLAYRTLRSHIDWESLVNCMQQAYQCALHDKARYESLSANAITRMQRHCSRENATRKLTEAFTKLQEEHCASPTPCQ